MQNKVCYGDILYIQYSHHPRENLLVFSGGFFDDTIFASEAPNFTYLPFKSSHFVVLPSILSNTDELGFLGQLQEHLQVHSLEVGKTPTASQSLGKKIIDTVIGRTSETKKTPKGLALFSEKLIQIEERKVEEPKKREVVNRLGKMAEESKALLGKALDAVSESSQMAAGLSYIDAEYKEKVRIENFRAERMKNLNAQILSDSFGKQVKYGENILLYHCESRQFLYSTDEPDTLDNTLQRLGLRPDISTECYFRFEMLSKYGNVGELVLYEAPMAIVTNEGHHLQISSQVIVNKKNLPDMHFTDEMKAIQPLSVNEIPKGAEQLDEIFPKDAVRAEVRHRVFPNNYPLGITKISDISHYFKLSPFLTYAQQIETQKLKGVKNGDYVRIARGKYWMTANTTSEDERTFFEFNDNSDHYEHDLVHSIFQVVHLGEDYLNSSKLPAGNLLKMRSRIKANESVPDKGFYLWNFGSGLLFDGPPVGESGHGTATKDRHQLRAPPAEFSDQKLTKFHIYGQITEPQAPLIKSAITFVQLQPYDLDDKKATLFLDDGTQSHEGSTHSTFETKYFTGYRDPNDYIYNIAKVSRKQLTLNPAIPAPAKFVTVSEGEMRMINESVSFANQLKLFYIKMLNAVKDRSLVSVKDLKKLTEKFKTYESSLFEEAGDDTSLFNLETSVQTEGQSSEGGINRFKQIYMRECNIISLCNKILFHLIVNSDVKIELTSENIKHRQEALNLIKETIKLISRILSLSIRNNAINHYYISQWIRIYISVLLKPGGVYTSLSPTDDNITKIRSNILPLIKEILWDKDTKALEQINYHINDCFEYIENQQDFDTQVLQLMIHIFRSQNPAFEQRFQLEFMEKFLSDPKKFSIFAPQLIKDDTKGLCFIFRRSGKEPVKVQLTDLIGKKPMTQYLINVLKLLTIMSRAENTRFAMQVVRYYDKHLLEQVFKENAHYEIKNYTSAIVENFHGAYNQLPIPTVPSNLVFVTKDAEEAKNEFKKVLAAAKEKLIGEIEQKFLKENSNFVPQTTEHVDSIKDYFTNLKLTDVDADKFYVSLRVAGSIQNRGDKLKDLELIAAIYKKIWEMISLISQRDKDVPSWIITDAFLLLKYVDECIMAHSAHEAIRRLETHEEIKKAQSTIGPLNFSTDTIKKIREDFRGMILDAFGPGWRSREKMYNQLRWYSKKKANEKQISTSDEIEKKFTSDVTEAMTIEIFKNEKDQRTLKVILEYLYKTTKSKITVLDILREYMFLDTPTVIASTLRLTELLMECDRIERAFDVLKVLDGRKDMAASPEGLVEELVHLLEEIFMLCYDCDEHTKNALKQVESSKRKTLFLEYIKSEKVKDQPASFVFKPDAIKQTVQKLMRILKVPKILLSLIPKFIDKEIFGKDYAKNKNIRLVVRLIMMLMIIFVYKNPKNQIDLSKTPGFIILFNKRGQEEKELFGVDLNTAFTEMLARNSDLLKMEEKYLIDISMMHFIRHIQEPFNLEKHSEDVWYISYVRGLNFLSKASFQDDVFNENEVILKKFNEYADELQKRDIFSFKSIIAKQKANVKDITMPLFYYVIQEYFRGLGSFVEGGNQKKINFLHQNIPQKKWLNLLFNENVRFQFGLRRLVFRLFDWMHYTKFRRPGVFKNHKRMNTFIGVILADMVSYLDFKNKHTRSSSHLLDEMLKKEWLLSAYNSDELQSLLEDYKEIISYQPLEEVHTTLFFDSIPLVSYWMGCLTDGCLPLLASILTEESNMIIEFSTEVFDYVLYVLRLFKESERGNQKIENEIQDLAKRLIPMKEFANYREDLKRLAIDFPKQSAFGGLTSGLIASAIKASSQVSALSDMISKEVRSFIKEEKNFENEEIQLLGIRLRDVPEFAIKVVVFLKQATIERPQLSEECHFAVRLLSAILYAQKTRDKSDQNPRYKCDPVYKWHELSPTDWKDLRKLQAALDEAGLSELILFMMEKNQKEDVLCSLFELATLLLYGGNKKIQDSFYKMIGDDSENKFATMIYTYLTKSFNSFKKFEKARIKNLYFTCQNSLMKLDKNNKITESSSIPTDLNAIFSKDLQPEDKVEIETKFSLLLLIIKFLQSLCEGHNTKFQHFLREQLFEGKKHIQSINFLNVFKLMYHSFFPFYNKWNAEFGRNLLGLMIESVEGETRDNAYEFFDNTLIEDLTSTLCVYDRDYDLVARGFGGNTAHELHVAVKESSLVLLRDLIEGSDPTRLLSIEKYLNTNFLIATLLHFLRPFFQSKGFVSLPTSTINARNLQEIIDQLEIEDHKRSLQSAIHIYSVFKHLWTVKYTKFEAKIIEVAKNARLSKLDTKELKLYVDTFLIALVLRSNKVHV